MTKIYCIPGLGANEKVFERIVFPNNYEKVCLGWIEPGKKESLKDYSIRLAEPIDTSEPFILLGLSFGGMVATVLSTLIHPKQTILISSVTGRNELPWYFRASGRMHLNALLHMKTALKAAPFALDIMGARTPTDKEFLKEMIDQASVNLVQWSIDKILNWDNRLRPNGILQIHGTRDMVLPHTYTHAEYLVEDGNHFMIRNKAEQINTILSKILAKN